MLTAKLAAAQAAAGRGPGPSVCRDEYCLKQLTPSAAPVQRCLQNEWPLPGLCWAHRHARNSTFAQRRLRDSADGPGGNGSGGTDPAHLPATVVEPSEPQAGRSGRGAGAAPHVAAAEDARMPRDRHARHESVRASSSY